MNNVMMNYQPLRSSPALRKNLAFKSDETTKPLRQTEIKSIPEDELALNRQREKELDKTPNFVEPEADELEKAEVKQEEPQTAQAEVKKKSKSKKKDGVGMFDFSWKNALKQFKDGFISPFVEIAKGGTKGVLAALGAGTVSVVALNTSMGKKLRPLLMTGFAAIGGYKIAKGLYGIAKNKGNAEKQEASFYDIGQGTLSTSLSIIGSKSALKAADPKYKETGYLSSFWQCIKRTREFSGNIMKKLDTPVSEITNGLKCPIAATAGVETLQTDNGGPTILEFIQGKTASQVAPGAEKLLNEIKEAGE